MQKGARFHSSLEVNLKYSITTFTIASKHLNAGRCEQLQRPYKNKREIISDAYHLTTLYTQNAAWFSFAVLCRRVIDTNFESENPEILYPVDPAKMKVTALLLLLSLEWSTMWRLKSPAACRTKASETICHF